MKRKSQKITYYEPSEKQKKYATRGGYVGGGVATAGLIGQGLVRGKPVGMLPVIAGSTLGTVGGRIIGVKLAGNKGRKKRTITIT